MNESYDVVWMIVFGTVAFLTVLIFLISLIFFFFKKQLANQKEKQQLRASYEQELLTSRIEVQNETFKYIAQELHDNIGQLLAVARLNLNMLEQASGGEVSKYIQQTNEIIGQAVEDVRALTKSFDGDFVRDFGLLPSLSLQLERIEKSGKFETSLLTIGYPLVISYEKSIVFFRIAQEVLNNAIKHSEATSIKVELEYTDHLIYLRIKDNGRGFDPEQLQNLELSRSGAGQRNMQRRATMLGGNCVLESEFGKGTIVTIAIPVNH